MLVAIILEKAMAPHSSTIAWKIPWMEEPGGLHSIGSLRVGHDWVTSLSIFSVMHWKRKWKPTTVLAWRIPGTREPGGLPSVGLHRVGLKWLSISSSKEPLYEDQSGELKNWLKTQHSKNEAHGIWFHHFMANRRVKSGSCDRFSILGLQNYSFS